MKVSKLLLIITLFFEITQVNAKNAQKQALINLNTFSKSPVDGCADYFYLSKSDGDRNHFICVRDFAPQAYLKINGKMERMIYKPGKSFNNVIYNNAEYSLNIKIISKKQSGPESYRIRAMLVLYHKSVIVYSQNVLGFGGC